MGYGPKQIPTNILWSRTWVSLPIIRAEIDYSGSSLDIKMRERYWESMPGCFVCMHLPTWGDDVKMSASMATSHKDQEDIFILDLTILPFWNSDHRLLFFSKLYWNIFAFFNWSTWSTSNNTSTNIPCPKQEDMAQIETDLDISASKMRQDTAEARYSTSYFGERPPFLQL